ncbi:hypothetical protein D3C76_1677330 [compost metagenome]
MLDPFAAVVADEGGLVVLDVVVLIPLRMNEHLLMPQLILETQFIETVALVGLAFDGHARLVLGQLVRR